MSSGLKIKQVADASGFTPATLRYYEQIGLLPEARRTDAGYRMYDQRTLDRLAFIARAKQLGCSLDEITGLTTAWDGGQCGPIQDRLRTLVAGKLDAARHQIAELVMFTGELQRAAAVLERHRPEGACDNECGCIGEATLEPIVQAVGLTSKSVATEPATACTLAGESVEARLAAWQSLLADVEHRQSVEGGMRLLFARTAEVDELVRLVAAEHECCRFLQFAVTVDTRGLALEVRAPDEARPIVESMFGVGS